MVFSYAPTYYSTIHDSITSLCKTILPLSSKNRRLTAADQKKAKLQSDNLKWQQDSFHQILNLMGLHKEGILAQHEVSAFKSHLLETLIASPLDLEQPCVLRDKLLFLQELLYAKCITDDEYHSSKRPLLQRLAVQGAEIETRDVIVAGAKHPKLNGEEEWSVIDLKDDNCLIKEDAFHSKSKSKHGSAMKQIKGAASVFGFSTPHKTRKKEKSIFDAITNSNCPLESSGNTEFSNFRENPFWDTNLKEINSESPSIVALENIPSPPVKQSGDKDKAKRKPFRTLFQREGDGGGNTNNDHNSEQNITKSGKKRWGFDGFKKWSRNDSEDETSPLPINERSDSEAYTGYLVPSPVGEGPDTRQMKKKLHPNGPSSDFFVDKVLGDKVKKELSRIQTELCTTNSNLTLSNDQIEAISTRLPVDKADLRKFFPKSWCEQYGDVVIDVVRKEFKSHVGEMENLRNAARDKQHSSNSMKWTSFEDDENCHPNLFANNDNAQANAYNCHPNLFSNNPFLQDCNKLNSESALDQNQNQNPFWSPRHFN